MLPCKWQHINKQTKHRVALEQKRLTAESIKANQSTLFRTCAKRDPPSAKKLHQLYIWIHWHLSSHQKPTMARFRTDGGSSLLGPSWNFPFTMCISKQFLGDCGAGTWSTSSTSNSDSTATSDHELFGFSPIDPMWKMWMGGRGGSLSKGDVLATNGSLFMSSKSSSLSRISPCLLRRSETRLSIASVWTAGSGTPLGPAAWSSWGSSSQRSSPVAITWAPVFLTTSFGHVHSYVHSWSFMIIQVLSQVVRNGKNPNGKSECKLPHQISLNSVGDLSDLRRERVERARCS